jgi:hypothetical protein
MKLLNNFNGLTEKELSLLTKDELLAILLHICQFNFIDNTEGCVIDIDTLADIIRNRT